MTDQISARLRKPTKTERLAIERLGRALFHLDETSISDYALKDQIPGVWTTLEHDIDVEEPRVKVTLLLDESVAKFFRTMGKGYQRRMNRVLATYAQMQISNVMENYRRMQEAGYGKLVRAEYRDGVE